MQVQDAVKLLYQSEFGGGHMIENEAQSLRWLEEESSAIAAVPGGRAVEEIGGGLCRLYLAPVLALGIGLSTVNRFFVHTANNVTGSKAGFLKRLDVFRQCCRENLFSFTQEEAEAYLADYEKNGFLSVHHSETYRSLYAPSYRVVGADYCRFLPLFCAIDQRLSNAPILYMAVDGHCAAGKSTLAALLQTVYDCNLIHMDDFFLPPAQKTPARLREPGGNVDYTRFYKEVIEGFKSGQVFSYRVYDCVKDAFVQTKSVEKKRLYIVEGVYSLHPLFYKYYGLKVFLRIGKEEQRVRIQKRNNAAMQRRFFQEWIPLEETYFREFSVAENCDLILGG